MPYPDIPGCFVPRAEYEARAQAYCSLIQEVVSEFPKVTLFDPRDLFCDEERCTGYNSRFQFLYRDVDHLSDSGSLYYAQSLAALLAA